MAIDLFGIGALSPGSVPDYQAVRNLTTPAGEAQMDLDAMLRAAAQQQTQLAVNNGNMDPLMALQAQQRMGAEDTNYNNIKQQLAYAGMTPEQRTAYDNDQRFGNDLSWLDPKFQYNPSLLGQSAGSQAYADPNAIAAQNSAMARAQELSSANMSFMDPGQQQAIMQQILGVQAPQFMSDAAQQQALGQINAVNMPHFAGAGTQQDVLSRALGLASNTGPGALSFDTSGRQGEQYGNLQGIIAGGGADAIEMARRQAARADSESWLRGQREADMQNYAERGLTGSGMELLNLAADRQAAAGRNSAADLQTAAALEQRKMDAINAASGLATNMRGQTIDEQGLLNNRATAGLNVAGSLANSMRSNDIQEQLGLTDAALQKAVASGSLASQMRGQTATEQLGLNQALVNQYSTAGDLATQMRQQQANEQIGQRNAQLSALNTLGTVADTARGQSAQEAQYRATAADDFSRYNQMAINQASQDNQRVLTDAYQQMMNNRTQTYLGELGQKTQAAISRETGDRADNNTGFDQGTKTGGADAAAFDAWLEKYRDQLMGIFQQSQNTIAGATAAATQATGNIASGGVNTGATAIGAIIGGAGGGSAEAAGKGAAVGSQVAGLTQAPAGSTTATTPEELARKRAATGY